MVIDDSRFLRTFARRFCGRSGLLNDATLDVIETRSGFEIHIGNGLCSVLVIGWEEDEAFILGPTTMLSPYFDGLEPAMTDVVRKFLHRHRLLLRTSTRKKGAA